MSEYYWAGGIAIVLVVVMIGYRKIKSKKQQKSNPEDIYPIW